MASIYMRPSDQFCQFTNSVGSILLRENPLWNRGNDECELLTKKSKFNTISKALISAVSRNKKIENSPKRPTMVRTSALLYEITDRTNRLAQPRLRSNVDEKNQKKSEFNSNRIPEATARVIELSRPRIAFIPNEKPKNCVSPNALRAIATQRILELSKPRKILHSKLPREKKRRPYTLCSARLEYLAKPRLHHRKFDMKLSKRKNSSHPIPKNKRKNLLTKQQQNINSKIGKKYRKLGHQNKKRKRILEASGSSRSVIRVSSFDQCIKRTKSRGQWSQKRTKRKLTWVKHLKKKNLLSTFSNSDHRVSLKRCEGDTMYIPTSSNINNFQ